jgi:chromosome partitioning protein
MKAKVITITNHKGGVGKTTSAVNIAVALGKRHKQVLLIDLDPQANLTQSLYNKAEPPESNIYQAMTGKADLIPINVRHNVDLIPSTIDLSGAELELSGEAGREYILSELLRSQLNEYDYIIIDTPPSIGLLTINSLTASDYVLIPVQAHYLAVQGLTKLLEAIDKVKKRLNRKLQVGGVFLTQFNERLNLNQVVAEYIHTGQPYKVFKTQIRNNIALATAPAKGQDIFQFDAKSTGATDYYNLTSEILKLKTAK